MSKNKKPKKVRPICRNCPGSCPHINHQIKDKAPRCIIHYRCSGWKSSEEPLELPLLKEHAA